ncbi:replication protein P [Robbsia andropogonis]|uniref:replication protein P n=1 Tax=Robbsia andropogonis TaxID=28092 RepID=UPI00209EEFA5|nr:replication protein P [Robbsia andropogonis]MCP1121551.1 replication protein P [Robbsia andropogonis]MCP1131363.1 replication protein P [Robbsia andropogonis]
MDHLFNRLDGMYPNRWRASFPSPDSIENWSAAWAEAFDEEGITPNDIAVGLKACRKRFDWPPSMTEFINACRPQIDVESALFEAIAQTQARRQCKDEWSNPAFFWAAVKVGQYEILSQTHSMLLPRFRKALDEVLKGEIKPVPASVPALTYDVGSVTSREKGEEQLRRLGAMSVLEKKKSGIDWAYRMLDRIKSGERIPGNGPDIARRVVAEAERY